MALGTATVAETVFGSVRKIVWSWVSGTAAAPAQDGGCTKATALGHSGRCIGLTTIPGAAGDAPTDDYDVTITDADGHDVLLGAGLNRDTANTEHQLEASMAGAAGSVLTLNVSNAGSANTGTVILYLR